MRSLNTVQKRNTLYGVKSLSKKEYLNLAVSYQEKGQISDAIDFFHKAEERQPIDDLIKKICAEGNTHLLLKCKDVLGEDTVSEDLLRECAKNAEDSGKVLYASLAYEQLGDEEKAKKLRSKYFPELEEEESEEEVEPEED